MNERIRQLAEQAVKAVDNPFPGNPLNDELAKMYIPDCFAEKFAELIVRECVNREKLLGAIARGWCSEKNSHKTMDSDLAVAIFDEVEQQIKQQFEIK
jgi:hypothetical protein